MIEAWAKHFRQGDLGCSRSVLVLASLLLVSFGRWWFVFTGSGRWAIVSGLVVNQLIILAVLPLQNISVSRYIIRMNDVICMYVHVRTHAMMYTSLTEV